MEISSDGLGRKTGSISDQIERSQQVFKLWHLLLIAGAVILLAGLFSEPFLGDEMHHYRFAKESFLAGKRAIFDSVYGTPFAPGYIFATQPLWPLVLSWIWRLIGFISFPVAQIYHTGFYLLLTYSTYSFAKHLYDKETGAIAGILCATTPMIVSFGILFYTDVPAAALVAATSLAFIKRKYVWMGILFGLAYLTKRHTFFLMPAFLLLVLFIPKEKFFKKIFNSLLFVGASGITVLPEVIWHRLNILPVLQARPSVTFSFRNALSARLQAWSQTLESGSWLDFIKTSEYLNSSLLNPVDLVKYFGPFLLAGLILYFVRRRYERKDLVAALLLATFMAAFVFILRLASDIRYTFPAVPFVLIIAAKGLTGVFRRPATVVLVSALCFLQLLTTAFYVQQTRQPSPAIEKGFEFIRKNIPETSLLMYVEANLLEKTERKMVWGVSGVLNLFWRDAISQAEIIEKTGLDYIVIKKSRVYDDEGGKVRHHGGFPRSFVESLRELPFMTKIFDNEDMSIWEIDHNETENLIADLPDKTKI